MSLKTKKKKSLVNHLIANFEGWIGHGFQRSCELLGPNFLIIDSPFLTYINVFVIKLLTNSTTILCVIRIPIS